MKKVEKPQLRAAPSPSAEEFSIIAKSPVATPLPGSEDIFRQLFDTAQVGLILLDGESFVITHANQSAGIMLNCPPAELPGKKLEEIVPLQATWVDRTSLQNLCEDIPLIIDDFSLSTSPEKTIHIHVTFSVHLVNQKRIIQCYLRDLSVQKQGEENLRLVENRYRNLFENSDLGMFESTPEGVLLRVNNAHAHMLGYDSPETELQSIHHVATDMYVHPENHARFVSHVLQHPGMAVFENEYRRKDGSIFIGLLKLQAIKNQSTGEITLAGYMEDITQHKLAENELKESEERYHHLFELESDALFLIDNTTGQILEANQAATNLYGYSRDELLKLHNMDLSAEPEKTRQATLSLATRVPLRFHLRKDGTILPVEINATQFTYNQRPTQLAAIRDISERLKAEAGLRESEERYRVISELTSDYAYSLLVSEDRHHTTEWVTPSFQQVTGYSAEEINTDSQFMSLVIPEDLDIYKAEINTLLSGQPTQSEYRIFHKDGSTLWLRSRSRPVWDEKKQRVVRYIGSVQNITRQKQAEIDLRHVNERFDLAVQAAQLGVWDWDIQNDHLVWDDQMYALYQINKENPVGPRETWLRHVHPDDAPRCDEATRLAISGEKKYAVQFRIFWPDGSIRHIQAYGGVVKNLEGKPLRLTGVNYDITQSLQAQEKLNELAVRLQRTQQVGHIGSWEINLQNQQIWASEEAFRIYGLDPTPQTLSLEKAQAAIDRADRPRLDQALSDLLAFGSSKPYDIIFGIHRANDDQSRTIHSMAEVIRDKKGQPTKVVGAIQDITEQKNQQEALNKEIEFSENMIKSLPGIFYLYDGVGHLVRWNGLSEITGYSNEMIAEMNFLDFYDKEDQDKVLQASTEVFRRGESSLEANLLTRNGQKIPFHFTGRKAVLEGKPYLIGIGIDISDRKKYELELEQERTRLKTLLQTIPDVILLKDMNSVYLACNNAFERQRGIKEADLIGKTDEDLVDPELASYYRKKDLEAISTNQPLLYEEWAVNRETGQPVLWETTKTPLKDADGNIVGVLAISRDKTLAFQAQEALKENEDNLRALLNTISESVFLLKTDGTILAANPTVAERLNTTVAELIGHCIYDFFPADIGSSRRMWYEQAVYTEKPITFEDIRNNRIIVHSISPILNDEGRVARLAVFAADITERKLAEEKILATLEEKEILLREIHHRVKNNLQAIIALIDMQIGQIQDAHILQFLEELKGQARTMSLIYEQLYQSDNLSRVKMTPYLQQLTSNILETFGAKRNIHLQLNAPISLDIAQALPCGLIINELFTNILKHAFPDGYQGQPNVSISLTQTEDTCNLTVADNGVGFSPNINWRTSPSQGLRLVNLWATHQLDGTLQTTSDAGVCTTITFNL